MDTTDTAGSTDRTETATSPATKVEQELHESSLSCLSSFIGTLAFYFGYTVFCTAQIGFGFLGIALCFACKCETVSAVLGSLSPLLQSVMVILCLLYFEVFDEIQSYLISWLTWSTITALTGLYSDLLAHDDASAIAVTLRFLGISAQHVPESVAYPLMAIVPMYPAFIVGLLANWWLVDRYALECDASWEEECAVEYDGVCCRVHFLRLDVGAMLGIIGGHITLGFAVTRYIVVSILANKGDVKNTADLK